MGRQQIAHRLPQRAGVAARRTEQGVEQAEVERFHLGVVQHQADRPAGCHAARQLEGNALAAIVALQGGQAALFAPVDIDGKLGQRLLRPCAPAARQRAETQPGQQRRRGRAAAVPGWREDRIELRAEQLMQPIASGAQVHALRIDTAFVAELALAPIALVVVMGQAVLMQSDQPRRGALAFAK